MASGDTILVIKAAENHQPSSNPATPDRRGELFVLDFDDTTAEYAVFTNILPRHYSGNGLTIYIHYSMTSAVSGTCGWTIEFERISDSRVDIDSISWATAQTVTAVTVPGTSGYVDIVNVSISNGANMDSIAGGEYFAIRLKRDVANDNATGDAEFHAMELKET